MTTPLKQFLPIFAVILLIGAASAYAQEYLEEYKLYVAALEAGDSELARRHAESAWRAAENELGDHQTTAVLAFNYAQLIYTAETETSIAPLERVLALIDAGFSDMDRRRPQLMLAFALASEDSENSKFQTNLWEILEAQTESGTPPDYLSGLAWLHLSSVALRGKNYRRALRAAQNAEKDFNIGLPEEPKFQGTALILQTAAYLLPRTRSKGDYELAHRAIYRAIYLYPPQYSVAEFDPEFAAALVWHIVVHNLAQSDQINTGTRLGKITLNDDNPVPVLIWRHPDKSEICDFEWLRRQPPAYPSGAESKGYIGGAMIGFNIGDDLSPIDVKVLAEVPYSSPFGAISLEAVKGYKLAKNPGPPECRQDYYTFFSFLFE